MFGAKPEVVVPPTFVWNDAVESAWAHAGVHIGVTPGVRNGSRDANGCVVAGECTYFNAAMVREVFRTWYATATWSRHWA